MVILGLILIVLGALAIVSAVFTAEIDGGKLQILTIDLSPLALFLVGLAAGLAILWGFTIFKYGSKRSLAQRREQKRLTKLSEQLDRVDAERRTDVDSHEDRDRPTL